jgi:hypothetical protein
MAEENISIDIEHDNQNPSNPESSKGETLPVLPTNLVQALVADKDALLTLTNAISTAIVPLFKNHADQSRKNSESENNANPAVLVGQSGVATEQSPDAPPVATGNTRKRIADESIADCIEIRAVKRPCAIPRLIPNMIMMSLKKVI